MTEMADQVGHDEERAGITGGAENDEYSSLTF